MGCDMMLVSAILRLLELAEFAPSKSNGLSFADPR